MCCIQTPSPSSNTIHKSFWTRPKAVIIRESGGSRKHDTHFQVRILIAREGPEIPWHTPTSPGHHQISGVASSCCTHSIPPYQVHHMRELRPIQAVSYSPKCCPDTTKMHPNCMESLKHTHIQWLHPKIYSNSASSRPHRTSVSDNFCTKPASLRSMYPHAAPRVSKTISGTILILERVQKICRTSPYSRFAAKFSPHPSELSFATPWHATQATHESHAA